MYGSTINQSILNNIGKRYSGIVFEEAFVMQFLFLVVLACHIPYTFYAGKEALLIIVDEIMRKSLSYTLSKKLLNETNDQYKPIIETDLHETSTDEITREPESSLRKSLRDQIGSIDNETKAQIDESMGNADINGIAPQDLTQLAYKSMNPYIYYSLSILMYISGATLGILLDDISKVFGFIGTFAGTGLCFFIPSWFYMNGYKMFGTDEYKSQHRNIYRLSIFNHILGIFAFGIFLYNNILDL
jgi:hypothetical protein